MRVKRDRKWSGHSQHDNGVMFNGVAHDALAEIIFGRQPHLTATDADVRSPQDVDPGKCASMLWDEYQVRSCRLVLCLASIDSSAETDRKVGAI